MRWIKTDRGQDRHDFAEKIVLDPLALFDGPCRAPQEDNAFLGQFGKDLVVEQGVLFLNQRMCFVTDQTVGRTRRQSVRGNGYGIQLDLLLEASHTDFEEFVKIAADDAQKSQSFKQWDERFSGL